VKRLKCEAKYSRNPLSGLIGTATHLDMQKTRTIGFFFENWLRGHSEVENNFYKRLF
jgi:hypothetical protein